MVDLLLEQLQGARSTVVVVEHCLRVAEERADLLAAELVAQCHEIKRMRQRLAQAHTELPVLEASAAAAQIHAALVARNETKQVELSA